MRPLGEIAERAGPWSWLLAHKVLFFLLALLALQLPHWTDTGRWYDFFQWSQQALDLPWPERFANWDGVHYLKIAAGGYAANSPVCAYYPLWKGPSYNFEKGHLRGS